MSKSLLRPVLNLGSEEYFSFQKSSNTWPYRVSAYDDLPEPYKNTFPLFKGSFPYTIIIPDENYSFFWKKGYMIVVVEDKLYIFEKLGSEIDTICFDAQDILYIESGDVLLSSWITIAGERRVHTFNFHSLKDYLFLPVIAKFRNINHFSNDSKEKDALHILHQSIDSQFKYNIKFRNLLHNQSIELEKVKDIVFQPNYLFSSKQLPIVNYKLFTRYISNHLILLTDEELVFIQECNPFRKKIKLNSDNIFTYVKLKNISSFEKMYDKNKNYYGLFFTLKNGTRLSTYFSSINIYLDPFISKLKQSIKMV